jgi:hypothetical protein
MLILLSEMSQNNRINPTIVISNADNNENSTSHQATPKRIRDEYMPLRLFHNDEDLREWLLQEGVWTW